ncbi:hypothetical protein [Methanosarcina acetivorans]|nr:hypothetical protein [Methanosarcina acetivorans]
MSGLAPTIISVWEQGHDIICRAAPHLLLAHIPKENPVAPVDAIIVLTHFDIAAPAFGIGTRWAGFVAMAAASYEPLQKSLFNFFWFFFNFKTTTKFHPNLSKSIHSFKNVDSFTQAFTKIFQIVELFLWEFPTATAISHQV